METGRTLRALPHITKLYLLGRKWFVLLSVGNYFVLDLFICSLVSPVVTCLSARKARSFTGLQLQPPHKEL